jgi:hypothetical protein
MSIHFLTRLDQSLSPSLSSVASWLRNKNIQCFEGGDHLVYGRIDLLDPESRHQAKVDFLFACEPGQIAQTQLEEHELLDPAFKKHAVTLMTSELGNELNNLSAKDIEILLWRALHQIPKNPAGIDFLHRGSTVTCHDDSTLWHLSPQSYAYICQNPNFQQIHPFLPNRHEYRFLMAISQDTPQNSKTAVEHVNYYIERPFSQNNQPVHINEHYHRFNELNWDFKSLVDPLVTWLERAGVPSDYHCLTITWLVQCLRLNEPQIALEVIGTPEATQNFTKTLTAWFNRIEQPSEPISDSDPYKLVQAAFEGHLINLGPQNTLSHDMQKDVVALLDGAIWPLNHLDFPATPKIAMRRPVVWACEQSLNKECDLNQRTLSIDLAKTSNSRLDADKLHTAFIAVLMRLAGYAMKIDHNRAQRTSPDVPEHLKSFDRLGNHLSPRFFGGGTQPYTSFGYEMDAYLPELNYNAKSNHDFY